MTLLESPVTDQRPLLQDTWLYFAECPSISQAWNSCSVSGVFHGFDTLEELLAKPCEASQG